MSDLISRQAAIDELRTGNYFQNGISKMEQVAKDINVHSKTEPQTERSE